MVKSKKNIRTNAMIEMKRLLKEYGFNAVMLKRLLAEARKVKK